MRNTHTPPLLFAFGLHAHQPEGNFDHVFRDHVQDVYEPFLTRAVDRGFFPVTLHLSGPLLSWMEAHDPEYLDRVGRLVADGKVELLLAGYHEPILPSLPPEDRVEQVLLLKEALRSRFGAEARGLWLTERVWEPELPRDLVDAGVEYVLVDDRHFVAAGLEREDLHAPFRTEAAGKSLGIFAIDEKLRYTLPFHPPGDTAEYLREVRARGGRLAVAADDIEKFGGWPGTYEWVYERGWMDRFMDTMAGLQEAGEIRLATFGQALAELASGGLVYLPSASYREMEEWSLPTRAQSRIGELKEALGEERFHRGQAPLIRGSHWRNFLVKYPESNRMHKKMVALSALCRERGNPADARWALGRAQCNDAYWHGVFGGLYLRHLRDTVWRNLAEAEGILRAGEAMEWEEVDLDLDGHPELWIHSGAFSALVSPVRGGAVEELTLFGRGENLANTLTRRREAYHEVGQGAGGGEGGQGGDGEGPIGGEKSRDGTPSIHNLEGALSFSELPPVDPDDRAIFLERVLADRVSEESYARGELGPVHSWAREAMEVVEVGVGESPVGRAVRVHLRTTRGPGLEKVLHFQTDGTVETALRWDPGEFPEDALFTTEISLGGEARVEGDPGARLWRFPIATFSKSERGFDETVQGESVLVLWPVGLGEGRVRLGGS